MSRADDPERDRVPRAMIHRRVLDVAETEPDASIEAIADRVSGASIELVERVLDEYGDPGTAGNDSGTTGHGDADADESADADGGSTPGPEPGPGRESEPGEGEPTDPAGDPGDVGPAGPDRSGDAAESTMSQNGTQPSESTGTEAGETTPELDALSEKQRTTARAVYENPGAPQEEIADALGVTRATVSRRLNDIPGFDWHDRERFVESLFDGTGGNAQTAGTDDGVETGGTDDGVETGGTDDGVETGGSDGDGERPAGGAVADIEEGVERRERDGDGPPEGSIPPELAHKVVHACMESDRISEDEELELLRSLMAG